MANGIGNGMSWRRMAQCRTPGGSDAGYEDAAVVIRARIPLWRRTPAAGLRRFASGPAGDRFRFVREWLRDPTNIAAVAPSGKALAALITRDVESGTGPVLELGPGTGVFTQALIARGVAESDLTLVEQNQVFAALLKQRFPRATVLGIDAAALDRGPEGPAGDFGAAICGLGLLSMEAEQVEGILRAAFTRMKPEAGLYLFTYGRKCSVSEAVLERLGLVARHVGTTVRNIPPASVYRLARLQVAG